MKNNKYLLIVDLQKQFKDNNGEYENCLNYIKNSSYTKILATIFKNNPNINSNYVNNLNWNDCTNSSLNDIEFVINRHNVYFKNGYSDNILDFIKNHHINCDDSIDIIGCDLDACIYAICFTLWDAGYTNFRVLTNYCYSTSNISKQTIITLLKRNFGKCIQEE